ncbi:MAG: uracil-DNA glycosylase [Thermodesulfobacteriota bacterium]
MEKTSAQSFSGFVLDPLREFFEYQKEQGRVFLPTTSKSILNRRIREEVEPPFGSYDTLPELERDIARCQRCRLFQKRRNTVPGQGPSPCRLMLIGEGPGGEEDEQGHPFVGPAGQLLTRMLLAIELKREEVYVTNVVKCRPPENRVPREDEIEACRVFLDAEIELVTPKLLLTLGNCSTQSLLRSQGRISELRGQIREAYGRPLIAMYHPAYLLRNPGAKREAWEDLKKVKKEYDRL